VQRPDKVGVIKAQAAQQAQSTGHQPMAWQDLARPSLHAHHVFANCNTRAAHHTQCEQAVPWPLFGSVGARGCTWCTMTRGNTSLIKTAEPLCNGKICGVIT
jgi:hypothetical protein